MFRRLFRTKGQLCLPPCCPHSTRSCPSFLRRILRGPEVCIARVATFIKHIVCVIRSRDAIAQPSSNVTTADHYTTRLLWHPCDDSLVFHRSASLRMYKHHRLYTVDPAVGPREEGSCPTPDRRGQRPRRTTARERPQSRGTPLHRHRKVWYKKCAALCQCDELFFYALVTICRCREWCPCHSLEIGSKLQWKAVYLYVELL